MVALWDYVVGMVIVVSALGAVTDGAIVSSISPNYGSLEGGTYITIAGDGYAADQFNWGDGNEELGNVVKLVSDTQTYDCPVHRDETHQTQIVCITDPMPDAWYYVKVSVDGVQVPDDGLCNNNPTSSSCRFQPQEDNTPTITNIQPTAAPPGSLVTVTGKIFTNLFATNDELATNGRIARIKRVYIGGQLCELVDETVPDESGNNNELYGIELDNDGASDNGHFICKLTGTFVGNQNATFLVDQEFGRARVNPSLLKVTAQDKIAAFQSYAVINSVTPYNGSVEGGTHITITGDNFDETDTRVYVGGEPCEVLEMDDNSIVCATSPEPLTSAPMYPGGRGAYVEIWNSSASTDMSAVLEFSDLPVEARVEQELYLDDPRDSGYNAYNIRQTGFFVPPADGEYQFFVRADDIIALYLSMNKSREGLEKIAECPSYSGDFYGHASQISDRLHLQAGAEYYFEVGFYEGYYDAAYSVGVHMFDTHFMYQEAGDVLNEQQEIVMSSTVLDEIQSISLSNWPSSAVAATHEVQEVTVTSAFADNAKFRLGLYGQFTGVLSGLSAASDIEDELDSLEGIAGGTFTVSKTPNNAGVVLTVTFNSDLGSWPLLQAVLDDTDETGATFAMTRTTAGVSAMTSYVLSLEGVPLPPLSPSATTSEVEEAFGVLSTVRCPSEITSPIAYRLYNDYETSNSYQEWGSRTSVIEPFCGSTSIFNPSFLYYYANSPSVKVMTYNYLCMAYHGDYKQLIQLRYFYKLSGDSSVRTKTDIVPIDMSVKDGWGYTCMDMRQAILALHPTYTSMELIYILLLKESTLTEYYVDSLMIGFFAPVSDSYSGYVNHRRLRPARWSVASASVTGDASGFNVTIATRTCADDFEHLSFEHTSVAVSGGVATYTGGSWTAADAMVTKLQEATGPVYGTMDILYKDELIAGIPANASAEDLRLMLETANGIGSLAVTRSRTCSGYSWAVDWISAPGDQPPLVMGNSTSLMGTEVTVSVKTLQNGGVFFEPIQGDMLRVAHSLPQVEVMINNIPAQCSGDCQFVWSDSQTPTMTAVTPTSGSSTASTELTITGQGFESTPESNTVTIGGVECPVTAATNTELTCDIGQGPAGTFPVIVRTHGLGLATHVGQDFDFSYDFELSSISPITGSAGGGTTLIVEGTGFGPNITVLVGSESCEIYHSNYSTVLCLTPAAAIDTTNEVVSVEEGGRTNNGGGAIMYSFPSASTPTLFNVSTSSAAVAGGEMVSVIGTGFGSVGSDEDVTIGGVQVNVTTWTDTMINFEAPSMPPGQYLLLVNVPGLGYAHPSNETFITYTFQVDAIAPESGSVAGGTILTVVGSGFPTEDVMVDIGSTPCETVTMTSTEITCVVQPSGSTINVDNSGTDPTYGVGYAWNPATVVVYMGDTVQWTWESNLLVTGMTYTVRQTASPTAMESLDGGFGNDAPASALGTYSYQFNQVGNFYHWSEAVDQNGLIYMRGTVKVLPRPTFVEDVKVSVYGHMADHDLNSGTNIVYSDACGQTVDAIRDNCTIMNNTDPDTAHYTFQYSPCHTPLVHRITPTMGSSADSILIQGSGFSITTCQNLVTVDGQPCAVSSATDTEITCQLGNANSLPVGVPLPLAVEVLSIGRALITVQEDLERNFIVLPHVSSVTPTEGSTAGGTALTIAGSGFYGMAEDVSVMFGGVACTVTNLNYTSIECTTKASGQELTVNATVTVFSYGQPLLAECSGTCEYAFSDSASPSVHAVDPTRISSNQTMLYINGSLFGQDTSMVQVKIGAADCSVNSVNDQDLYCTTGNDIMAGDHKLDVIVLGKGHAVSYVYDLLVDLVLDTITPDSGSENGGSLVTIAGMGFDPAGTSVVVGSDGPTCVVTNTTGDTLICSMPPGTGLTTVYVTSNNAIATLNFTYSSALTPTVTAVDPTSGNQGDTITITGTTFGTVAADLEVSVGGVDCAVTVATDTVLECTVGAHSAGQFALEVYQTSLGYATSATNFTYGLQVDSVSPDQGSFAGGQIISIVGNGFDPETSNVTVDGVNCELTAIPTATHIECETPPNAGSGTVNVNVVVSVGVETDSSSYSYKDSLTPEITGVEPVRGGTGGNTLLTITGTGFGTTMGDVSVTLAGSNCTVESVTNTEVQCRTAAHSPSTETQVRLEVATNGIARQTSADFQYIDVWSSVYSWGGVRLPEEGDMVVIPKTMTILLDTTTPTIKFLLIQGGKLIFDNTTVELHAEYILISDGGSLQVGTEDEPYEGHATIELHGHTLSSELPLYGSKCLAVREGTLDLHGMPVAVPWTRLAATANVGDTSIVLQESVNWEAGQTIVIATTGDKASMPESETRTISSVSSDGLTVSFTEALEYKHLGETVDLGSGYQLDAHAEVGMYTRNIVIRGSNNAQWNDVVEPCPDGFNAGEFTAQTCFQGRFGEEIGSDEFGAHVIMQPVRPNENLVVGRIEYVELTYVGQAFRLGRYAIHFHLHGEAPLSYIRGCAIYRSFNRAVNIHGTHFVTIEHNVIYNIKGGAFFLEDGIEIGNVFQYNLALFVIASSSLQNDDITPAAYWITNANNTYRHNVAAGGTHFGFWLRMHEKPDGPSFDPDYCPRHIPMGTWHDNVVHSQGWFGIWIFQDFYPMQGGGCDSTIPEPAKFYRLTAWNNEKGAEWVNGGAMQFHDFYLVNNELAGVEMKTIVHADRFTEAHGAMLKGGAIVASDESGTLASYHTQHALVLPLASGLLVDNITFVNFNSGSRVLYTTKISGTSDLYNGGFEYHFSNLTFVNTDELGYLQWENDAVWVDLDGSLTGTVGGKVIPATGSLPPSCTQDPLFSFGDVDGFVCPSDVTFHRISFNEYSPSTLEGTYVEFTNQYGTTSAQFMNKRMTHKSGWMAMLVSGETYHMEFVGGGQITNISYVGIVYGLKEDDFVIIQHNFTGEPDKFQVIPSIGPDDANSTATMVNNDEYYHGDWHYDPAEHMLSFLISGRDRVSKRDTQFFDGVDRSLSLQVYQCYYVNCGASEDQSEQPLPGVRPDDAVFWSDPTSWDDTEADWGGNNGDGTFGPPADNTDVKIPEGVWMVADTDFPVINRLFIYGVLEFEFQPLANGDYYNFTLSCQEIVIVGGRLIVGWEDNPFLGMAEIVLRGSYQSEELVLEGGVIVGAKAMGVFGGLDLHGRPRPVSWTHLAATAEAGTNVLVLAEATHWEEGDEVVITTTTYSVHETEVHSILSVADNGTRITLSGALEHKHLGVTQDIGNGRTLAIAAEVGLLTRNVKIVGEYYNQLFSESFGARILVGTFPGDDQDYYGYARVDNVEFLHCGQEGYSESYDPRYPLAWLNTGDVTDALPSYIRDSAFYHSFSTAIGVYGTNGLQITNNVVYNTVGSGIVLMGADNAARGNLVAKTLWPGSYNGRMQPERLSWEGCFETIGAIRPVLIGNTAAGCERVGFATDGEPCTTEVNSAEPWADNVVHAALFGVGMMPSENSGQPVCTLVANFTAFKNGYTGLYYQAISNLEVIGYTSVDNPIGLFPMVIEPMTLMHQFEKKFIHIKDSHFVGTSDSFDCEHDVLIPAEDYNIMFSEKAYPEAVHSGGKVGLVLPSFSQSTNFEPQKPFFSIMAYPAMYGLMVITGIHFHGFTTQHCDDSKHDIAIVTNSNNDDLIHPTHSNMLSFSNVDEDKKVLFHWPKDGAINPSDCVDMHCDGKKKCIVEDLDGTLLGSPGTLLPNSERGWDEVAAYGLGDYRIPTSMLTDPNGDRLDTADVCPNQGIVRDESCTYSADWHAWHCHNLDYQMLIVESMDEDWETRRLSPVGIMADGYIDLINGPMDHGWCSGYTCQLRISLFPIIVATGKTYTMHFTGTAPQHSRYHFINTDSTQAIVVAIFFSTAQRMEVYVEDTYIAPLNAVLNAQGQEILEAETSPGEYLPDVASGAHGDNYFDDDWNLLYVLIRGDTPLEIRTSALITLSFSMPAMTVDEFFGENIANNLALFLGIPAENIIVANAVAESKRKRRKRSDTMEVTVHVGSSSPSSNSSNATVFSAEQMGNLSSTLVDAVQMNLLGSALNITILSVDIMEALPAPGDESWGNLVEALDSGVVLEVTLQIPASLEMEESASHGYEMSSLSGTPKFYMLDTMGARVEQVGSWSNPWKVTASIIASSNPDGTLYDSTVNFNLGWANFTDLAISHEGDYTLEFAMSSPSQAIGVFESFMMNVTVEKKMLEARIANQPSGADLDGNFTIEIELVDSITGERLEQIDFKNHTWISTASLHPLDLYAPGVSLDGATELSLSPVTGYASQNMTLNTMGRYFISFNVVSDPVDYNLTVVSTAIDVEDPTIAAIYAESVSEVSITLDYDYDTHVLGHEDYFLASVANTLRTTYGSVSLADFDVNQGSIIVTFSVSGSSADVVTALDDINSDLNDTLTFTYNGVTFTPEMYLMVDGGYYGDVPTPDGVAKVASSGSMAVVIVVAVVVVLAIVAMVISVAVYKSKLMSKTHVIPSASSQRRNLPTIVQLGDEEDDLKCERRFEATSPDFLRPPSSNRSVIGGGNEPMMRPVTRSGAWTPSFSSDNTRT